MIGFGAAQTQLLHTINVLGITILGTWYMGCRPWRTFWLIRLFSESMAPLSPFLSSFLSSSFLSPPLLPRLCFGISAVSSCWHCWFPGCGHLVLMSARGFLDLRCVLIRCSTCDVLYPYRCSNVTRDFVFEIGSRSGPVCPAY